MVTERLGVPQIIRTKSAGTFPSSVDSVMFDKGAGVQFGDCLA